MLSTLGMLFLHELYHFTVDTTATHLGMVANEPTLYESYFKSFYNTTFLTDRCIEESLATRYAHARYKYLKVNQDTLTRIFNSLPAGYRQYSLWVNKVRFGERKMVRKLLNYGIPKAKLGRLIKNAWFETLHKYRNQVSYFRGYRIPIYLVQSGSGHLFRIRNARMK